MGKRLYCGNLPFSVTTDEVRAIFAEDGRTVTDVHIVTDRETGRSRGFAFVELATDQEAEAALRAVDGRMLGGRALAVKEARERESRPGGFGGRPAGGPRGPRAGGPGPGFRGGAGGPTIERRPSFGGGFGGERGGFGGPRGGIGGDRGGYGGGGYGGGYGGGGYGGDRGFDRGGRRGGDYGRAPFPPEPFPEPEYDPMPQSFEPDFGSGEYGPPEDVDYRERGDRGKRGRDRRGGRRRGGDDFGGSDW